MNDQIIQAPGGIQAAAKPKPKKRKVRADKGKPKRARATSQTPEQKAETPLMTSAQRRDAAHANAARPERVPMAANYEKLGSIAKLYKRDGFHLRMFRDEPGRLAQAQSAHYIFVVDDQGNQVSYQKGKRTNYLMELPDHLWEEEKALLQAKISNTLNDKQEVGPDEYLPEGRTQPMQIDQRQYDD